MSPAFDRRRLPEGLTTATWATADGHGLRMFDWPAAADMPRRGALLFQSGRSDFLEKYLEAMAHWQGRGWDVAGFDWRGQGGSQKEGPADLDSMLADLTGFVAAWRGATAGPHVAVGHSMGGHLLLRLLAEIAARSMPRCWWRRCWG
jgi:lysophospholipase